MIRKLAAYLLLLTVYANLELGLAQAQSSSGLPAPTILPFTATTAEAAFAGLTNCATATDVFTPATGNCTAPVSGGLADPGGNGVVVRTALNTTSAVAAPTGTILGTTDTQTMTNKTVDGVTPTTFGFLDATSSIQTQLTAKAAKGANSDITSLSALTTPVYATASYESVSSSATPTLSAALRYSTNVLTANVTSFTLGTPSANGFEKTVTFCQNGTGGFTVTPPSNVHGFMTVGTTASKCSSQHFNYDASQTAWLSDGPGVINQ